MLNSDIYYIAYTLVSNIYFFYNKGLMVKKTIWIPGYEKLNYDIYTN